MQLFRLVISGDFLNERGESAYGGLPLEKLDAAPHVRWKFLRHQAPQRGDASYWQRFYSLKMQPEDIAGQDGLIVLRPGLDRATLTGTSLLIIGRSGAGYDKVDVAACTENDVALFNAPLALEHATASTALLFLLALAKRLPQHERMTRQGRWDLQSEELGDELTGRTLGIIGLGHNGRELVRLVAPFGMRVIAYSPHADAAQATSLGVELCGLDELLKASDFVSIHARPSPENYNLIGQRELSLMKPSAYLVNVARGVLVDQPALVEALRERRIRGAALDVFAVEPLPVDDPLIELDNVILTPHWSASTRDIWRATGQQMVDGLLLAARGELPANIVNRDVLDRPGFRKKLQRFEENR